MLNEEQLEKIANPVQADIGGTQSPIVTQMAIELLSLREQLAELKALQPVAEFRRPSKKHEPMVYWFGKQSFPVGTQLFTAAKPEALPRHIYSMLVNELRDVPAIGCKRELIVSVLNRHGVIAELVGG
ncbi:hypothetical protein ACK2R2_002067 [Yersinia enterocolitica]